MNGVFNLVVFFLFINISAGIFTNVLDLDSKNIKYNPDMAADSNVFGIDTNTTTGPVAIPSVEDNSFFDWTASLLNLVGLGFLIDIGNFLSNYLFGFSNVLNNLIPAMPTKLIIFLNIIIGFGYTFAVFSLLLGRRIDNK